MKNLQFANFFEKSLLLSTNFHSSAFFGAFGSLGWKWPIGAPDVLTYLSGLCLSK